MQQQQPLHANWDGIYGADHSDSDRTEDDPSDGPDDRCSHYPRCTLPKHPEDVPHSYERVGSWKEGARRSTRGTPNYYESRSRAYFVDDVNVPPPTQPIITLVYDDVNGQAMEVAIDPNDLDSIPVPTNFKQARSSTQWLRWKESMDKEIKDLLIHDTWETMKRSKVPSGRKVTKSKWVYTIKYNRDGTIERFKSRFVACGYSQVEGEDYSHSFSATMRATSFRTLLALAAGHKLRLDQFDVTNAFTQSDIDADIYVEPPPGYYQDLDVVLKLKKSLYGTKQASRLCYG